MNSFIFTLLGQLSQSDSSVSNSFIHSRALTQVLIGGKFTVC